MLLKRCGVFCVLLALALTLAGSFSVSAAEQKTVELTFLNIWGGTRVPLVERMLADFQKQYPYIKVTNLLVPGGERRDKILLTQSGGSAPDVVMTYYDEVFELGAKGVLIGLDGFLKTDKVNLAQRMYPAFYEQLQSTGDQPYYLPLDVDAGYSYLYGNESYMNDAGLDARHLPRSWDELKNYARKLTKAQSDKITRLGIEIGNGDDSFFSWLVSNGGSPWTKDGKILFNGPEGEAVLDWITSFTNEVSGGWPLVEAYLHSLTGDMDPFVSGAAAMTLSGSFLMQMLSSGAPDLPYVMGLRPAGPKVGEPRIPARLNWGYAIPASAKHPKESWLLAKYMTLEEGGRQFLLDQGRTSAIKAFNDNPANRTKNSRWASVTAAFDAAAPVPPAPYDAYLAMDKMTRDALQGKVAIRTALEQGAKEAALAWAKLNQK